MTGTIDTSLDLFERVVRARGVAYSEWTPGEDRIYASPALAALFDLDPEDWTVQRLMDHIHPDDAEGYRAGLTAFMKSDADRAEITVRYRRRNGGISCILNHNYAERDPSGRVTRLTTTSTDVTQDKEREAENRALLARQAASVEVLKAITASPDDPQPVFDLIVRRACELCNAQAGNLVEYDGTLMHQRTLRGFAPEAEARLRAVFPRPPGLDTLPGRVVLTGQRIHLPDAQADQGLIRQGRGLGARAFLGVPLLREGEVIGVLGLARFDPGEYDQSAIELVQSFAEQAVIAIAGAKTLRELRDRTAELAERNDAYVERIAHQSATIDVLKAMSASPGDPQPVFDLIAERARDICGGYGVTVTEFDGTQIHHRASTGVSEDPAIRDAAKAAYPMPPSRDRPVGRAILDREIFHTRDHSTEPGLLRLPHYDTVKSSVTVPLMRGGTAIGALAMGSRERGGFSDTQVELLKTFAEQAVIAMSSAETYRALESRTAELQQSLDYQTATIDVLKVMSTSIGDTQPVFGTILNQAMKLCGCMFAVLTEFDGTLIHGRAAIGFDPEQLAPYWRQFPMAPTRATGPGRAILDRTMQHVRDILADPEVTPLARALGQRSQINVPLLRGATVIGVISLGHKDVDAFTEAHIELLKTFAEQAVIAIGGTANYRALETRTADLQESLEYQTATSDVLKVISRSTFDLQPVLNTLVETAARLCDAEQAVINRRAGDAWRFEANFGFPPEFEAYVRSHGPMSYGPDAPSVAVRATRERRPVHIHDVAVVPGYPDVSITLGRQRTSLGVPLMREGEVIGTIVLARQRVEPFTERQIDLVSTFADQAVIAIENTRLLTEQQEALEQQTATAEVLGVINRSPGNLVPVFEAILEKAHTLCGAAIGSLYRYDGEFLHVLATHGFPEEYAALIREPVRPPSSVRTLIEGASHFHVPDIKSMHPKPDGIAGILAEKTEARATLAIPLRKDGTFVGHITAIRTEARPFSGREIALLENFAAQAVIAMENARLLTEQREALEQQTATAEVLQVINASPGNLVPVFNSILEKSMRLCEAAFGALYTYDGEHLHPEATQGLPGALVDYHGRNPTQQPPLLALQVIEARRPILVLDLREGEGYRSGHPGTRAVVELGGARTVLLVPLLKEQAVVGFIQLYRQEVRAFTDKQVALLRNFAAQAVIAMENARLITETREALEQQTATAEVLGIINRSPGDLTPVFKAILEKAHRICHVDMGSLWTYDGTLSHVQVSRGYGGQARTLVQVPSPEWTTQRRLLAGDRYFHAPDMTTYPWDADDKLSPTVPAATGGRAVLVVPLRKDGVFQGHITNIRREPGPFSDKEIVLLENFAAQAVIAMENARLINEQREALEQQTATAEVLQVINASAGDLTPVFDTIVEKAHALCGASVGSLMVYDGTIFRAVATHGYQADTEALLRRGVAPTAFLDPLFRGERICVRDAGTLDWSAQHRDVRTYFEKSGINSILVIPLLKEQALLGYITNASFEARSFSDKQITLLENFAAQAVIAMESARLLNELRARTDELAQRQAELHVTFENMGDGVAMFDQAQHLVAWNRKFQDLLDVPDDIIAQRRSLPEYVRYLAERGEFGMDADVDEQVRRVLHTTGQMRVFERVRPNGSVIEVHSNPIAGGGFVLIYSDITERKRNEKVIHAARDAAEEASRTIEAAFRELKTAQANLIQAEKMASLGQLTAGIAHEIKNPLNFVNNFAILSVELLNELKEGIAAALALLTEDQRADVEESVGMLTSNLEKITEHGKRADGIVKAMLEHSRGESGERRTVDINVLANEALNLAYHGARAQDQSFDISLERDFGGEISPIEVNPQDMTRVFLNLFSNGFYAANKRERNCAEDFRPTLKVTTRAVGDAVEIRVRDNGTGISADIRDKLFQPFFTTKPTGEGTGLGLSITYDIVTKAHGGTIAVDSEIDEFTEFVVTLPRGMFSSEGSGA